MDPALALAAVDPVPVRCDQRVVALRGMLLPVLLPAPALDPGVRARLALAMPDLAVEARVPLLLEAGAETEAWALVAALPRPIAAYGRLDAVLSGWAARELARSAWPAPVGGVVVVGDDRAGTIASAARGACADAAATLAPLYWLRWSGPLVVVAGEDEPPALAGGREVVARPALPLVRLRTLPAGPDALRGLLAGRLAALSLALQAPPRGGWPPWLRLGVAEVAAAKGRGEGPSPKAMHQLRQQAGGEAIAALLAEDTVGAVDRPLAGAVCAWLLSGRRSERLPALLEALRAGRPSAEALQQAYQADPARLVAER